MNYEQKYKKALERAKKLYEQGTITESLSNVFPELKESEDERIRKAIIGHIKGLQYYDSYYGVTPDEMIAWLEKQGDTNETINRDEFAQGVLRGAAINLITWIDYNAAEGNTCLSNMECKDIEDSLVRGDWNKIYAYMKKKLEEKREQIVYAILSEYAKDNGLVKYEYPDGFYCFGDPDCQELADKKHEEWLMKKQ